MQGQIEGEINLKVLSLSDEKEKVCHLKAWKAKKIESIYLKLMNLKLQDGSHSHE